MAKVLIIAPDYEVEFGHVGKSLELFSSYLGRDGFNVELVVPVTAPRNEKLEAHYNIHYILPSVYETFLVPGASFNYPGRKAVSFVANKIGGKYRDLLSIGVQRLAWLQFYTRALRHNEDLKELLRGLQKNDYIFMPSADNLVTREVIRQVSEIYEIAQMPKVVIRFINVLENVEFPKLLTKKKLFAKIKTIQSKNHGFIVASETSTYKTALLASGLAASVIHYPPSPMRFKKTKSLETNSRTPVISTLGSARPDKGFERLAEIIPQYLSSKMLVDAQFVVQAPARHWGYGSVFAEQILKQTKNVSLKPGILSDRSLMKYLAQTDVNLLPYYQDVYQLRGSAMLYEACDLLIPSIAPFGTGFGDDVDKFELGVTFIEFSEIPKLIAEVLSKSPQRFQKNIEKYNLHRLQSLRAVFK